MKICPTWYHEINKMKTELRHKTVATVYLWYIYSVCVCVCVYIFNRVCLHFYLPISSLKVIYKHYKGIEDKVTLIKRLFHQIIFPPRVWWKSSFLCNISLIKHKYLALCNSKLL